MVKHLTNDAEVSVFDIDAVLCGDLTMQGWAQLPVTMDELERVLASPDLMPPGTDIQPMGHRGYRLLADGMADRLLVTTDATYYEESAESVEFWLLGKSAVQTAQVLDCYR